MVVAVDMMMTNDSSGECVLSALAEGRHATVSRIATDSCAASLVRRLAEIGFLPGESLRVLAKVPGGDPIAVRIGSSTFALRRHEAACIHVIPE